MCVDTGTVRLVSSSYPSSTDLGGSAGHLEIYYSGEWGTVCDDGFSHTDAHVVWRQLGYQGASRYGSVGGLGYVNSCCTTTVIARKLLFTNIVTIKEQAPSGSQMLGVLSSVHHLLVVVTVAMETLKVALTVKMLPYPVHKVM